MDGLRLTTPLLKLLRVFLADPTANYGFEIMKATGLASGTVYPLLARLEGMGWLESGWDDEQEMSGRPRRRYYQLTGEGVVSARVALAEANSKKRRTSSSGRLRPALGGNHR
jgi:PadR family transcriptional regulator